jgi:PhoH-like ATPase
MGRKDRPEIKDIGTRRDLQDALMQQPTGQHETVKETTETVPRLSAPPQESVMATKLRELNITSSQEDDGKKEAKLEKPSLYKIPFLPHTSQTEIYVVDTCYALNAETILQRLKDCPLPEDTNEATKILVSAFPANSFLVFPITVVEELDKIRKDPMRDDQVRATAREWYNGFLEMSDRYGTKDNNSVYVLPNGSHLIFNGSLNTAYLPSNDHRILQVAFEWMGTYPQLSVTICSDDLKVCLSGKLGNLKTKRHEIVNENNFAKKFYVEVKLENFEAQQKLLREGEILLSELEYQEWMDYIYPHQIINFFTLHGRWCNEAEVSADTTKLIKLTPLEKPFDGLFNLGERHPFTPGNREQENAVRFIFDPNIAITCLVGKAGSGKTCIALASALALLKPPDTDQTAGMTTNGGGSKGKKQQKGKLAQLIKKTDNNSAYHSIIICRALETVGKDMGFLPGGIDDKLSPWTEPIIDNLKMLLPLAINGETYYSTEELIEKKIIQFIPAAFLRGRTIRNSIIILDEAQNFTFGDLKTIITRNGMHSQIIITGDLSQIDIRNSGFYRWVKKIKRFSKGAVVLLSECLRSELANWAAEP